MKDDIINLNYLTKAMLGYTLLAAVSVIAEPLSQCTILNAAWKEFEGNASFNPSIISNNCCNERFTDDLYAECETDAFGIKHVTVVNWVPSVLI